MATIKSYTDLEQSKKLAENLPLKSADMVIWGRDLDSVAITNAQKLMSGFESLKVNYLPCWSLAALLGILPPVEGFRPIIDLDINLIRYEGSYRDELCFNGDNLIDACVDMIEKLHELKIL